MKRNAYALAAAAMAIGLVASACSSSPNSSTTTTGATTSTTSNTVEATTTTSQGTATTTAGGSTHLQSLIPAPANSQRTDGPDTIHDNGIHTHFLVNGSPTPVMDAYKTALEGTGWSLTVENSSAGGGGGGATYTGTNGGAYGVFAGGGFSSTTDVDACAWPSKPSNTNCGHGNG
jgi:hypothetical protein